MAIGIVWDQASDASATIARDGGSRAVRCALVSGLTTDNTSSQAALGDAIMAALAADGGIPQTYPHPSMTDAQLAYVTVRVLPQDPTRAKIWAGYEPPNYSGSTVDRFAIEDTTTLVNEPTQYLPETFKPLVVSLTTAAPPTAPTLQDARFRVVDVNYPRNFRALVLNGLFTSKPSIDMRTAANRVNDRYWQGLAAGYWRCEGPRVRWSSSQGLYAVSVGFLSRGDLPGDDWSTYSLARDPTSGSWVQYADAIMTPLLAQSYAFGIRNQIQGVLKAGLYKTANFGVIFDSLIDDTPLATHSGFANLIGGGHT